MAPIQLRGLYLSQEEIRNKWDGKPACDMSPWLLENYNRIYLSFVCRVYASISEKLYERLAKENPADGGLSLSDYLNRTPGLRDVHNLIMEFEKGIRRLYVIGLRIERFAEVGEAEMDGASVSGVSSSSEVEDTVSRETEMGLELESTPESIENGPKEESESTSTTVVSKYRVRSRNVDDEWENHEFDSADAAIECCVVYAKEVLELMVDVLLEMKQIMQLHEERGDNEELGGEPPKKRQRTV
ncbi:hypothetical protein E2P81_ATG09336 [Venturia nashicola]|uniref:Uncharacterized protein n=1 Tax=Venturia nashicola TaxID=86259 RepID=A0A4Z1NZL7_9PEZI|nr:hypothetical protein E6O75_ATG09543 [Venturia nashicola]TLD25679.1 hypothetical protein E2P81_ATG09336 [Venturia nashicola]